MTKINITRKATILGLALIASFTSCAASSISTPPIPPTPEVYIPAAFGGRIAAPGHGGHRGEMMLVDKGTFKGGHRGAYKIAPNGDKIQTGEWIYWYPNGKKQLRAYYKNGIPHGKWITWAENGQLIQRGYYSLGKETGKWTLYYMTGKKRFSGYFHQGLEQGLWTFWYPNGKKRLKGKFKKGDWHGTWTFYNREGRRFAIAKYKNGKLISKKKV